MKNLQTLLTAPPIIAIPIYIITSIPKADGGSVSLGIWILLIIFVLTLTVMYIRAALKDLNHWLVPLQFLAQGGILSVLAIRSDIQLMSWIGVLLVIIGLILSGYIVFFKDVNSTVKQTILSSYDIFESYPFPACVTDKNGLLISISNGLTKLIGKDKDELFQMNVDSIIPTSGRVQFGDKLLQVNQQESKDRTWYAFNEERIISNLRGQEMLIQDTETDIFSKEYCRIRIEEEVVRIKRYKRWGVFMLIKLNFIYDNEMESNIDKKSESVFFRSFCKYLKNSLRNSDTVSRVDEFSVFIILPETLSEEPVNGVINKILGFSNQLSDAINQLQCRVLPTISHIFYNASSSDMTFDDILAALNKNLSMYDDAS